MLHGQSSGVFEADTPSNFTTRLTKSPRDNRQELDDFFDNAAVGLHIVSGAGEILRVNRAELDMLGYHPDEYVGRSIRDFHADPEVIEDILARLSRGEALHRYPARLRARDGSIRHVEITSNGKFVDGQLLHTRCFTVDVTDQYRASETLKEKEQQARDILNALPAAIYTTDADGKINFYNEAAVEFSGRRPQLGSDEWCVTWRLYETDGTPLPHDQCPMAVALKEGRPVRGAEAVAERPDGTRVPFIPFPTPIRDASGAVVGAVNMLVDISAHKKAEEQQRVLIHELNHRVKNTLAIVQSIASQTMRNDPEPEAFSRKFEGRLQALSKAHDLLTRGRWTGMELSELIKAELSPFAPHAVEIAGDEVLVSSRVALAMSMIVHELATNAAKYGALSTGEGRLRVGWIREKAGAVPTLVLNWSESNGPAVSAPTRHGLGMQLIERSVRRDLNGELHLALEPAGLRMQARFPLE
jgi:PAS domain S-box-containing protein